MAKQKVIVQASSRSWSGAEDLCMGKIRNKPAIYWTIKRILDCLPNAEITIAAPAFDRGGALEFLPRAFGSRNIEIYYGHDDSPLDRLLEITANLRDEDHIIRVDGLHFCVDVDSIFRMLELAKSGPFDCVKFPDDFPVQFTSDIYGVGALRRLSVMLKNESDSIFRIHPKYYMFLREDIFQCAYLQKLPTYRDEFLNQCRELAKSVYRIPRSEVNQKRIWQGDQLSFHYELAKKYLIPNMKVLDIACGDGYGTRMLAGVAKEVIGGDIDPDVVSQARHESKLENVHFHVEDVTNIDFADGMFDAVISMETIEHVDADDCLREITRVLRPGGLAVISSPQNAVGRIPINAMHLYEYSLEELSKLCERYLKIREVIGIKAGRIIIPGSPKGTNTVMICEKPMSN